MTDPSPTTPAPATDSLESRQHAHIGSPTTVAIRHLRNRPIAIVCFGILVLYFGLAFVSYLRLPDSSVTESLPDGRFETRIIERRFIGEWFEELATRRLVDPREVPLEYAKPLSGSNLFGENGQFAARGFPADARPLWETAGARDATEASAFHFIFGTDVQGRSVFWLTLYGARTSLTIATGAALLVVFIGTFLGAVAGYLGGLTDVVITWLFTTVASIPRILLVLAAAYAFRDFEFDLFGLLDTPTTMNGTAMLVLAMGLTSWVGLCRLIRGEIIKQRSMDYESAARALGVRRGRILFRHLLPNAFYLVIIQFSLIFPLFIHLEVILSYLGFGSDAAVSWGQMIDASLQEMMRSPVVWWQLTAATLAVFGISLALNLFGDALRDALDPKIVQ